METPRSPIPDEQRLDVIEKALASASGPKKASRGYRDMRWLVDQLRQHHGYIAGLTGDGWCRICKASLVDIEMRS